MYAKRFNLNITKNMFDSFMFIYILVLLLIIVVM